jgi:hypothetical protein
VPFAAVLFVLMLGASAGVPLAARLLVLDRDGTATFDPDRASSIT